MRATHELIHGNTRIAARSNETKNRNFQKEISQLCQRFVTFLAGNFEPKVQRISNNNWRVFDPKTNRSIRFASEQEVRVWLEERYSL